MYGDYVGIAPGGRFILVYLGVEGAMFTTSTGRDYDGQRPNLAFGASHLFQWRTDGGENQAFEYDGASWTTIAWDFSRDIVQSGDFVEIRIPLADIGVVSFVTAVSFHMSMVTEESIWGDWTRAGVPSESFTDWVDPDYNSYFDFQIGGTLAPNAHSSM